MLDQVTRRQYLSEAFHSLSQPVTALQCGLELAIAIPRSREEYERRIGDALQHTANLREMLTALREVTEAEDPGEDAGTIDVGLLLSDVSNEMRKLADLHACPGLQVRSQSELRVRASATKLSRVLLFLSEQVATQMSELIVEARRAGQKVEITIESDLREPNNPVEGQTLHGRVREMRLNAACNYVATLAGVIRAAPMKFQIELPFVSS